MLSIYTAVMEREDVLVDVLDFFSEILCKNYRKQRRVQWKVKCQDIS